MEKTNIQRGALSWKLILEAVPKRCLTQLKVKLFPWAEKKKGGWGGGGVFRLHYYIMAVQS